VTETERRGVSHVLVALLVATAIATIAVEALNWWYSSHPGWGLSVRTGWALLRSLGFLWVIYLVRRRRVAAAPVGLVLAITTIFAVARLVVPRGGYPAAPGIAGFVLVTALCLSVAWALYRVPAVRGHLTVPGRRGPVPAWLITARVAALTYAPLMLVSALVGLDRVFSGRVVALPVVIAWLIAGIAVSYVVLFLAIFLVRGHRWPRIVLVLVTAVVLAIQLPLCWLVLGIDGLVRDGGSILAVATLAMIALLRAPSPSP
jgi:hypothetical protein